MISLIHKVEKEGDSLMVKENNIFINSMLTRGGDVNNTFFINNKIIKDYEITSLNTSDFS